MTPGTLFGVGVGPGDPELITVKGLRLLQRVRRVFLPATAPGRSYAGTIAACYLDPSRQEVVELVCPPLRDRAALLARWTELAHDVAVRLGDGEDAVFLTEGDPSLYSTFQYLRQALARDYPDVPISAVPGITSVSAAAAVAGMPLAMWDERLAIIPGTAPPEAIASALAGFETVALLKPSRAVPVIEATLPEGTEGEADVTLVRRAGRPEQAIFTGGAALREAPSDYFSLLIARNDRPSRFGRGGGG